jgi:hypothetical protein
MSWLQRFQRMTPCWAIGIVGVGLGALGGVLGSKEYLRLIGKDTPPPNDQLELARRFIEECSLQKKSVQPCPELGLSPLALLGKPTVDVEALLARAQALATHGAARVERIQVDSATLQDEPPLNATHILPIHEQDFMIGHLIAPRRSNYIFERGMKSGDIVLAVNGRPTWSDAMLGLAREPRWVVEVLRENEYLVVVIERRDSVDAGRQSKRLE